MTDLTTYPFQRGQFCCKDCHSLFYADKGAVVLNKDAFASPCPDCGELVCETPQMANLHKTIGSAKGAAMSEKGREKVAMNGFSTGSSFLAPGHKGKIPMPPAKPGKYPECEDCQDMEGCKESVEAKRGTCVPAYCHRKLEVTWMYASAFLSSDPDELRLVAAQNAAQMQMVFNASIKKIFERGVEIVEQAVLRKKDGTIQKDDDGNAYFKETIYAHPLIKQCITLAQVMGFSLGDWTMTPKSKEAKEQVAGFLAGMSAGAGKNVEEVSREMRDTVDKFSETLKKAGELRAGDKTLQVFESESAERDGEDDS